MRRFLMTGAITVLLAQAVAAPSHSECRLEPGPRRTVTRIIDAETLALDDGSEVRLAGALAPRAYDASAETDDWPPERKAVDALTALVKGRNVVLGYLGAARRDRQNRHVAQVFVVEDGKETWVQGQMLRGGHARAYQQKDQRGCWQELLEHEAVARNAGVGLWSVDAYIARPALRTRDLAGMTGRFVILTGRIAWVAPGREVTALGFTPTRLRVWSLRRGVIVMIDNHDRDLLGSLGGDVKALEGKTVEVRGWIERRLGRPEDTYVIDATLAGMIDIKNDTIARDTASEIRASP